jgi:hypothetical protein
MLHHVREGGVYFPPGKSPEETAEHVLARVEEGTRETDVLKYWDGEVVPW